MVRKLKRSTFKKYKKSKLIYGCNCRFYKYLDIRKINISFKSKYSFLVNIFNDLDKLSMVKTQKERTKEKKMWMIQLSNQLNTCQKYILIKHLIYQIKKK